jgi:TetR/AcrR family transcriptional repressor of mexJK operon
MRKLAQEELQTAYQSRKRQDILISARAEFLEHGLAAASIERIASNANVSKVTIYKNFKNKDNLFAAVVEGECIYIRSNLSQIPLDEGSIRTELNSFAAAIMNFLSDPSFIRFDRRISEEAERNPTISKIYLEASYRIIAKKLSELIEAAMAEGRLANANPDEAAAHFYGMVRGLTEMECRFLHSELGPHAVTKGSIEAAVERFLLGYRP